MIADLTFKLGSFENTLALTKEMLLSAIHAFAYHLDKLRRDPRERQKQELTDYFHNEFEADQGNRDAITEALGL